VRAESCVACSVRREVVGAGGFDAFRTRRPWLIRTSWSVGELIPSHSERELRKDRRKAMMSEKCARRGAEVAEKERTGSLGLKAVELTRPRPLLLVLTLARRDRALMMDPIT